MIKMGVAIVLMRNLLFVSCVLFATHIEAAQIHGRVLLLQSSGVISKAAKVDISAPQLTITKKTDDVGSFFFDLPMNFGPGDDLTVDVTKNGWVIYQPIDGIIRISSDPDKKLIDIVMITQGSKKLWSDERIEQFISGLMNKLQGRVKPNKRPEEIDFGPYIKEWAVQLGFSYNDAQREIDKWASEIETKSQNYEQLGKAAYYKKEFSQANIYFKEYAGKRYEQSKEHEVKARTYMNDAVRGWKSAGDAAYSNYDFNEALAEYHRAESNIKQLEQPFVWAEIQLSIAKSYKALATLSDSTEINDYFDHMATTYGHALEVYTRKSMPMEWAATQNKLASGLLEQSRRLIGDRSTLLLSQSIEIYKSTLEVRERTKMPKEWAETQNNLANALRFQAESAKGDADIAILKQAIDTYHSALEVRSSNAMPQEWAETQHNLATALRSLGEKTYSVSTPMNQQIVGIGAKLQLKDGHVTVIEIIDGGPSALSENLKIGDRIVAIGQGANGDLTNVIDLTFDDVIKLTRGDKGSIVRLEIFPVNAREDGKRKNITLVRDNIYLVQQATGVELLDQAITACQFALEVRTRETMPQEWAETLHNLAMTLEAKGKKIDGKKGDELLAGAVKNFQLALEIRTRDQMPQAWAETQQNLGVVLKIQGERTNNSVLIEKSKIAVDNAKAVFTNYALPRPLMAVMGMVLSQVGKKPNAAQIEHIKPMLKASLAILLAQKDEKRDAEIRQINPLWFEADFSNRKNPDGAELNAINVLFEILSEFSALNPISMSLYHAIGWSFYKDKDYPLALKYLEQAWVLKTDVGRENLQFSIKLSAHLGEVLWVTGNKGRALDVWNWPLEQGESADMHLVKEIKDKYIVSE